MDIREAKQMAYTANVNHHSANPSKLSKKDKKAYEAERDKRIKAIVAAGYSVAILYADCLEDAGRLVFIEKTLTVDLASSNP